MKNFKTLFLFLILSCSLFAQNDYKNAFHKNIVKRNYLFLDKVQTEVSDELLNNKNLTELRKQKQRKIKDAIKSKNYIHIANAFMYNEYDNKIIHKELVQLSNSQKGKKLLTELRSSMAYSNYNDLRDEEFITKVWDLCVAGINEVIKVYGKGEKPLYPKIDSVSYDPNSDFFKYSIYSWADLIENKRIYENEYFFTKSLDFVVSLLYLNHRDEAIRYESLNKYNAKAIDYSKTLDFIKYPYSSIIVLGNGPENYMDRLTSIGKLNLQLGVMEFFKGNAPFIIVSGGHVHPFRSNYAEALEMKKELMDIYGIDEKNIIIDPYARHTTTNLRNATRLLIEYNIPIETPSLVVTNIEHSDYTYSPKYIERSLNELGYSVGTFGKRLSTTTIEFFPSEKCLQQNPLQPLDP